MLEYQYIANRDRPNNWGPTIVKLVLIALLVFLVHRSDQEHEARDEEVKGLRNTVAIQSRTISSLMKSCPSFEMVMPLGRKK